MIPLLDTVVTFCLYFVLLLGIGVTCNIITDYFLRLNIAEFTYCLIKRDLFHYLDKTRLVCGDIVLVEFRGMLKKATIETNFPSSKTVRLSFDSGLDIKKMEFNDYHYSRIFIPKHLSKASKILFAVRKDKHEQ